LPFFGLTTFGFSAGLDKLLATGLPPAFIAIGFFLFLAHIIFAARMKPLLDNNHIQLDHKRRTVHARGQTHSLVLGRNDHTFCNAP
jgi:hypothetical protein